MFFFFCRGYRFKSPRESQWKSNSGGTFTRVVVPDPGLSRVVTSLLVKRETTETGSSDHEVPLRLPLRRRRSRVDYLVKVLLTKLKNTLLDLCPEFCIYNPSSELFD